MSQSTAPVGSPPPPAAHTLGRLRGKPALAAVPVVALCAAMTGILADGAVEHGDLAARDPAVTQWLVSSRTPLLSAAAQVVTTVGSEPSIGILTVLALVWLVFVQRAWGAAALVAGTMGTAAVLTVGLKHLVGRQRPPASDVLGPLESSYAFPSGHTLFSTVFFGLVAGLLLHRVGRAARVALVLGWVGASAAVGASRLYLGYHWLTDVVASWCLATAVLAAAAAAWVVLRQHPLPEPLPLRRRLRLDTGPVAEEGS